MTETGGEQAPSKIGQRAEQKPGDRQRAVRTPGQRAVRTPGDRAPRRPPGLVSIVVPAYNESENVSVLACAVGDALGDQPYELIFVDDGSDDDSFDRIETLAAEDARICGLSLSRNFGHQYAISAGLAYACGDVVITMDADMQHPPSVIGRLIECWRGGANIVHTRRIDSLETGFVKRLTSRAFYRVFSLLCGVSIEPGMADFRLLDRMVVDEFNATREGRPFLRAMFAWMGYKSAVVTFDVGKRFSGRTKYSWRKMMKLASDGILSFSTMPLRIGLGLGVVTATLSFIELGYVLVAHLRGDTVPGWASTVGVLSLLFGILFVILGIQGQYLLRLYERANARPPYIVERIVRRPADDTGRSGAPTPAG